MGIMTCDQKYRSICRFPYQMTIYDSKGDVIETIFLQFGFLSLGLLMITENLIASGFVWQSSNAVSLSLLVQWSDVCCYTFPLISLLLRDRRKLEKDLAIPTVLAWLRHFLGFSSEIFLCSIWHACLNMEIQCFRMSAKSCTCICAVSHVLMWVLVAWCPYKMFRSSKLPQLQ